MTRTAWFATGVLAYAIAMTAMAPAALLDAKLADASLGRLRLTQALGTVWSGSGVAELRDASGRSQWTQPLAWRLRPASLLRGRIEYAVAIGPGHPAMTMMLSGSRIEFSGLALEIPAAALGSGIPALQPLGLAGHVQLRVDRLDIGPEHTQGSVTMQWKAASSALSPVSPLGDYELRVVGQGSGFRASLRTLRGPLELIGHGQWRRGEPPAFLVTASLPPEFRTLLAPFLRVIAVERAEGSFEWQLR